MPTAPATTIVCRAATTACACWRRSIAPGDLLGISEVGEAAFVDGDAGDPQPLDQLQPSSALTTSCVAAQRDLS